MPENATNSFYPLQKLILPQEGICTEKELYVHTNGPVAFSLEDRHLKLAPTGTASFQTWFNLFNTEKWRRECELTDLLLSLGGTGKFELSVFLTSRDKSPEQVFCETVDFSSSQQVRTDLSHVMSDAHEGGLLHFEVAALTDGTLEDAQWQSAMAPRQHPDLAVVMTTFKREAAATKTIERFAKYRDTVAFKDHLQLIVVDNGRSLPSGSQPGIDIIPNDNLGGAGGFTRGLLEARDRRLSHCLFMDDDASIHMESLERAYLFLSYAIDPATAIAAAMITEQHRWEIWEYGALFNMRCIPLFMGTDLRKPDEMIEMEQESSRPVAKNFYGGWWFFAFPIKFAEHLAFPFFVRGDDVSFSLANDFNIVTLNGVVSFQESFTDKQSPLNWYLDLRSHMAHHLSLPSMEVGRLRVLKIAVWFLLRNLPRMHYETMAAINMALDDVMKGPGYFDRQADVAERRQEIKTLALDELWHDVTPDIHLPATRGKPPRRIKRLIMKLTLNGHLIPGYSLVGRRITLSAKNRGHIGFIWGAARVTYLSVGRDRYYTVRHSKLKAVRHVSKFSWLALLFLIKYPSLLSAYQSEYPRLTSERYWREKLGMPGQ